LKVKIPNLEVKIGSAAELAVSMPMVLSLLNSNRKKRKTVITTAPENLY
jgi:hypothetical protein